MSELQSLVPSKVAVHVTMIKKKLASGEPCKKCAQAEDMLRRRDLWEEIDEVVWADETDASSAGMILAKRHGVDVAPFFMVERNGEAPQVFPSAIVVAKEVLAPKKAAKEAVSGVVHERVQAFPGATSSAVSPSMSPCISLWTRSEVLADAERLSASTPRQILEHALERLGQDCAIAFSGAEDVVLIDMAAKIGKKFTVFSLDTGRLHSETYRFIDTVRQFYGVDIHVVSPNFVSVEALVRKKGLFSFYEDGHEECCGVRKVEPLRRALAHSSGWVTGQRRDQSPTRTEVPVVLWDTTHKPEGMPKVNPLAAWSQADVWNYIRDNDVPYNELHDRGFVSIGCEPCTRAVRPGEHERAARWWWEDATKRECGLHVTLTK